MKLTTKLLILAAAAFAMMCFTGCSGFNVYSNADKYDYGNRDVSEQIDELDINWSSGEVSVVRHDLSTISIVETCTDKLDPDEQVHTWVDGKTLRIHFAKSGEMFFFGSPKKKLEIRVPKDMTFKDVKLDGSSCDSRFEAVKADHIYADVSSGDVNIIDCTAKTFDVDTSSGDTKIVQLGESDSDPWAMFPVREMLGGGWTTLDIGLLGTLKEEPVEYDDTFIGKLLSGKYDSPQFGYMTRMLEL